MLCYVMILRQLHLRLRRCLQDLD